MIELKDFIVESLRQIIEGVDTARNELIGTGAMIAPRMTGMIMRKEGNSQLLGNAGTGFGDNFSNLYAVEFDVAVVYSQESGGHAKIGVLAGVLGAGGGIDDKDSNTQHSHVKFTVPLALAVEKRDKHSGL
jgi:hypothetical protein